MEKKKKVEVVLMPTPAMGHVMSAIELAKVFAQTHQFTVTVLLTHSDFPARYSAISSYISSVAATAATTNIHFLNLPTIDHFTSSNQTQTVEAFVSLLFDAHKTHVEHSINSLLSNSNSNSAHVVVAFIIDFFSTTLIDVGRELGVPTYVYVPSGAAFLGLMLHLPKLDEEIECDHFKDYEGEIRVPGLAGPFSTAVMPSTVMRKNDGYSWFVYHCRRFRETSGLIVNTFAELEARPLEAITSGQCVPDHVRTPPVYAVGPLLALEERPEQQGCTQLMDWLDQQPPSSVLFMCFGSMGTFSSQQVHEIAHALERSGHRFLWCLRHRSLERFGLPIDPDLNEALPSGFLDRTRDRGLVWPSWAPQVSVLGHMAVRGFVSHCGWNSILESIWFGVPILAWPLFAEQRLNAFQMVRDYGLAVELQVDFKRDDNWVSASEIERGVRSLMDESSEVGQRVRERVREMSEASRKAVDKGGSSHCALGSLAQQFVNAAAAAVAAADGC